MREYKLRDCKTLFVECHHCGKEFNVYLSKIKRYKRLFCSRKCYNFGKRGAGNPNWRGKTAFGICETCGKEFTFPLEKTRLGKYCSPECKWVGSTKRFTQEEAYTLLGELNESPKTLPEFARSYEISVDVLKRCLREHYAEKYETVMENRKVRFVETYRRGRAFEKRTQNFLLGLGYIVMPSPRSMGPADLLAVRKKKILLVQCKLDGRLRRKGRENLLDMAMQAGGTPLIAADVSGEIIFTSPSEISGGRRKEFKPE